MMLTRHSISTLAVVVHWICSSSSSAGKMCRHSTSMLVFVVHFIWSTGSSAGKMRRHSNSMPAFVAMHRQGVMRQPKAVHPPTMPRGQSHASGANHGAGWTPPRLHQGKMHGNPLHRGDATGRRHRRQGVVERGAGRTGGQLGSVGGGRHPQSWNRTLLRRRWRSI